MTFNFRFKHTLSDVAPSDQSSSLDVDTPAPADQVSAYMARLVPPSGKGSARHIKQQNLCYFGLMNRCNFADKCSQHHITDPELSKMIRDGLSKVPCERGVGCSQVASGNCLFYHPPTSSAFTPPAPTVSFRRPVVAEVGREKPVCHHYLVGMCRFGADCEGAHPPAAACKGIVARLRTKKCNFGSVVTCQRPSCLFTHRDSSPPPTTAVTLGICRHYIKGCCTFGDQCSNYHIPAEEVRRVKMLGSR